MHALNDLMTASIKLACKDVPDNYIKKVTLFVNISLTSTIEKAKSKNIKLINIPGIIKKGLVPKSQKSNNDDFNDKAHVTVQMMPVD